MDSKEVKLRVSNNVIYLGNNNLRVDIRKLIFFNLMENWNVFINCLYEVFVYTLGK